MTRKIKLIYRASLVGLQASLSYLAKALAHEVKELERQGK